VRPRFTILGMMALIAILALELSLLPAPLGVPAVAVTLVLGLLWSHPDGRAVAQILGSMAAVAFVGFCVLWVLAYLLGITK
jgi:hypothetical protein